MSVAFSARFTSFFYAFICVLFLGVTTSSSSFSQTLSTALEGSWHHNIAFSLERRKLQESFEVSRRAAIDLGPIVTLSGNYGLQSRRDLDGTAGDFRAEEAWGANISLEQSLFRRGQVYSQYLIASYDRRIAYRLFRKAESQLILDGLRTYLGVIAASAALRVSEKSLSQLMEQWEATRRNASLGGASSRDVALATASLAEARAEVIDSRARHTASSRAFRDHFGIDQRELESPEELSKILPSISTTLVDARASLREHNFDLLVARLELQKQRKISRATRGLVFIPSVSLQANYAISELTGSVSDSFSTKLVFSYPLRPLYFMSGYRSVLNVLRIARDNARLAEQSSERELLDAWENLQAAQESEKARLETVEARGIVLRSASSETRLGTGSLDELLEAERDFAEAERAAIVARNDALYARFVLLQAIGTLSARLLDLQVPDYSPRYFSRWGLGVEK